MVSTQILNWHNTDCVRNPLFRKNDDTRENICQTFRSSLLQIDGRAAHATSENSFCDAGVLKYKYIEDMYIINLSFNIKPLATQKSELINTWMFIIM